MLVDDIAKETSYSRRTVARRLEKMRENHVLLKSKIDKRIITQKYSSLSSAIDAAAINDR